MNYKIIFFSFEKSQKRMTTKCSIPLPTLYEKFKQRWGEPNMKVIEQNLIPESSQEKIDAEYDWEIKFDEISYAIKRTSSDSAPGSDYIIPRTLKIHCSDISPILAKLATLMLKWNYVPKCFKEALSIL